MTSRVEGGVCSNCDRAGAAFEPCPEPGCARRDYRFVPLEYAAPASSANHDPLVGRMVDGALVVARLGVGGFGRVYLALQSPMWMKVALKMLDLGQKSPEVREVALRTLDAEARALAALSHPNIVRLLRYGILDDVPYLAMEFVGGGRTLEAEIESRVLAGRPFPVEDVRVLLGQLLDALDGAHLQRLVHRDLKPANVMVQPVTGNPLFVRLLDFGLAKDVSATSETAYITGTPEYMAPEQIECREIGPWSDLYALGVIAYELLSGEKPFVGDSFEALFARKLDPHADPAASLVARDAPSPVVAFFRKALAREPRDRFQDVTAFRGALEAMLAQVGGAGSPAWRPAGHVPVVGARDLEPPHDGPLAEEERLDRERRRAEAFRAWLASDENRLVIGRATPSTEDRPARTVEPPAWRRRDDPLGAEVDANWEAVAIRASSRGRTARAKASRHRRILLTTGAVALAAALSAVVAWLGRVS